MLRKQSDKESKPEQGWKERKKDERLQEAEDRRKRRRQQKRSCWQDQMKTVSERQTGDGRGREQPSQRECAFNINPAHLPNRASLWPGSRTSPGSNTPWLYQELASQGGPWSPDPRPAASLAWAAEDVVCLCSEVFTLRFSLLTLCPVSTNLLTSSLDLKGI